MRRPLANIVLCFLALTVAVPESYARRLGAGRTIGRQAPAYRQRSAPSYQAPPRQVAPPPAYVPPPRPIPDVARRPLPVNPNYARQGGSSPWGGMLGGALVGLGLGSLLGSHERNANNQLDANGNRVNDGVNNGSNGDGSIDPNAPNQMSGADPNGTTAGGAGQAAQPAEQRSGFGSILLWGLLALVAFMLFRRSRARAAARRF